MAFVKTVRSSSSHSVALKLDSEQSKIVISTRDIESSGTTRHRIICSERFASSRIPSSSTPVREPGTCATTLTLFSGATCLAVKSVVGPTKKPVPLAKSSANVPIMLVHLATFPRTSFRLSNSGLILVPISVCR